MKTQRVASAVAVAVAVAASALPLSSAGAATKVSSHAAAPTADEGTNRGGLGRTGWYPEANLLTPSNVLSQQFGQLFSTPVLGQVYAQPVVDRGVVIVATERNYVYALNETTGAIVWSTQVGATIGAQPFNELHPTVTSLDPWNCTDLQPNVGITSTPAVDPATGTIYLVALEQLPSGHLGYYVHALSASSGAEQPGFPVEISGNAQNQPGVTFTAWQELQRPAVTLTGGVAYVGFSSHCDHFPYEGFVAGVSTTGKLRALWADVSGQLGGGIWQSGGGFASDAPGQLLVSIGNGDPTVAPSGTQAGTAARANYTESTVRLVAQPDGSLRATDFFSPTDAATLDQDDLDFGSGAPVLLPNQFGTKAYPNLVVQTGKEGYVYLLNAQHLGGVGMGSGAGDVGVGLGNGALSASGTWGGAWSTPGVWPGDQGYVYIPTASGGTASLGNASQGDFNVFQVDRSGAVPALTKVAKAPQAVGFGTSSPVITSRGLTPGSAVVWVVEDPSASGIGATLQAYRAVPSGGVLPLLRSWPIGTGMKFTPPGVGDNRLFVPTRDGRILGFGLHAPSLLSATNAAAFPATTIGSASVVQRSFTASSAFTVDNSGATPCGVCTSTSQFTVKVLRPALVHGVLSVAAGQAMTVAITFAPTGGPGLRSDELRMVTSRGEVDVALSGTGRAATAWVQPSTWGITLPGYTIGSPAPTAPLTFTNFGQHPAVLRSIIRPTAPFTVTGLPALGTQLSPGATLRATVSINASVGGVFSSTLEVVTSTPGSAGTLIIHLSAAAATPGHLSAPTTIAFGSTPVGGTSATTVTVTNTGGTTVPIASIATTDPAFVDTDGFESGTGILPGGSVDLHLVYQPSAAGAATAQLVITTTSGSTFQVPLSASSTGDGYNLPAPQPAGWNYNGSAMPLPDGSGVELTPAANFVAGTTFWSTPLSVTNLSATFTAEATDGTVGDGLALVLADAATATPTAVGGNGAQVGAGGLGGLAVVLGEIHDPNTPDVNYVGVADGIDPSSGGLHFLATASLGGVSIQDAAVPVAVSVVNGQLTVTADHQVVLQCAVTLPPSVLVGFSAGTGLANDVHLVSGIRLTVGGSSPTNPLTTSTSAVDFTNGSPLAVGAVATQAVTLTNSGESAIVVAPPSFTGDPGFSAVPATPIVVPPSGSTTVVLRFQPTLAASAAATVRFAVEGSANAVDVSLAGQATGRGGGLALNASSFAANGTTALSDGQVTFGLAQATPGAKGNYLATAGDVVSKTTVGTSFATVSAQLDVTNPYQNYPGGDGAAIFFATSASTSALGGTGRHVGFSGGSLTGLAVICNESQEPNTSSSTDPSKGNFIAVSDGSLAANGPAYLATAPVPSGLFDRPVAISVLEETTGTGAQASTTLVVFVDGRKLLSWTTTSSKQALTKPVRVGFSAATGASTVSPDLHRFSDVAITAAS